ncbi:hypothetical protein [Scytonema sp. PCC 10023]
MGKTYAGAIARSALPFGRSLAIEKSNDQPATLCEVSYHVEYLVLRGFLS